MRYFPIVENGILPSRDKSIAHAVMASLHCNSIAHVTTTPHWKKSMLEVYQELGYEPPKKTSNENILYWLRTMDPQTVLYCKIGYLPPLSLDASALVEAIWVD